MRGWIILALIAVIVLVVTLLAPRVGATNNNQCNRNNPENCPDPIEICENGQHTGNPHCLTPSPTATSSPVPTEEPTPTPEATNKPSPTLVAIESPIVTSTPVATETPKQPEGKDPPEKSSPCYYMQTSDECKSKEEVFPGETEMSGPMK